MPFKKGDPKPEGAGRQRGTPNKKSLLVHDVLANHGINLVDQILVRLPKLAPEDQVRALTQMLPYVYPKLTSVQHSGEINTNPYADLPMEELEALVKKKLKEKK